MAFENIVATLPGAVAGADLRLYQHHFVKQSTTANEVTLCGDGELPVGVLLNKPNSGEPASVAILGAGNVCKVVCGAAVTAGDKVSSGASGVANTAASSDYTAGIAIDTVASVTAAEVVSVLLVPVAALA